MLFLDREIVPLGMGCWPIGGAMFSGDQPLGYANADDAESIRTIHAALAGGIELFDTAPAYGAGHAERLLGRALKGRPDALVVTKLGIAIDEATKQLLGDEVSPASVQPAIDRSLARLGRDRIDLLLLHQNSLPVAEAEDLFDEMEKACRSGKIRAYGWSTDFSASVRAVSARDGFAAVEHAMNVLLDAPRMEGVVRETGLAALIRSPLAMGLLSGNHGRDTRVPSGDIRSTPNPKTAYFQEARANPRFLAKLDAVRDLLKTGGRSLVQGALGWLWARSADNIPIPGARTSDQIEGICEALRFGALPDDVMAQIEASIDRGPEATNERAR